MYRKQKKQDPLTALQEDINELGLHKYIKAKKAKVKARKAKEAQQQENFALNASNNVSKLPSIYENGRVPLKFASLHNQYNDFLLTRIKEFENRINDLQTENTIKKKQNDKLMEHIAKLRVVQKNSSQSKPQIQAQSMMPQMFSHFQQPYMFPPPYMGQPPYNPYQPQQFGNSSPPPFQPQNKPRSNKPDGKRIKLSLLSRFRVAGFVVYFSLFFKKYSKSFTIQRFDLFKQTWLGWNSIQDARDNLNQYFRSVISLEIFERQKINDLDSLKNLAEQKKKMKKQKQKQKLKKQMKRAKDDSDSDSDSDSEEQSEISNSQNTDKKSENNSKNDDSSKVFQFYLKIDVAVAFVVEFAKQISKCLQIDEFYQKNPFLILLLSRSFQPDYLHEESDFGYLCAHPSKGYSQSEKAFIEYLLIKNVYLFAFTEGALLSQFGRMYYIDKKKDNSQSNENRVFFSFFIRTSIFKIMIKQYLSKKLQKIKASALPQQQLRPFSKSQGSSNLAKNRVISLENNGIDMKEQNIQEISQDEIRKKQRDLKTVLDESCQIMFKKLLQHRKKVYLEVKTKTLSSGYREQQAQYFRLHTKQELAKAMETNKKKSSLFEKTSQSVYESQAASSLLDNVSISNRIKEQKKKTKELKKVTKKQSKKPPTPIKDEESQSQEDSD